MKNGVWMAMHFGIRVGGGGIISHRNRIGSEAAELIVEHVQNCWLKQNGIMKKYTQSKTRSKRYNLYKFPRSACSRSIASNRLLKLPAPKPSNSSRWMISMKTVGRSISGLVNSCSR